LMQSDLAAKARKEGIDIQPEWACGAKVFVSNVMAEYFHPPLAAYHVVIHPSDEPSIHSALQHLPWNFRRIKPGSEAVHPVGCLSLLDVSSDGVTVSDQVTGDSVENEQGSKNSDHDGSDSATDVLEVLEYAVSSVPYRVKHTFIAIPSSQPEPDRRTVRSI